MTILIVLVVRALIFFGVGAVVEGLFWMLLIGFALVVAALWFGWSKFPTGHLSTMAKSGRRTSIARPS